MENETLKDYMSIKDFLKMYPNLVSLGSLRWLLQKSKDNGSDYFVRKIGKRKLVISPKLFMEWLEMRKRAPIPFNKIMP